MLVSILVLFFRLRLIPSMPMPGEPRALGLDRDWSDVRLSAQTAPTQKEGRRGKGRALSRLHSPRRSLLIAAWTTAQNHPSKQRKAFWPSLGCVQGQTCIVEPLLQQWLQFAHVLKAQIQGLKARDGRLAEVVSIQLPHGQANVPLGSRREKERDKKKRELNKRC